MGFKTTRIFSYAVSASAVLAFAGPALGATAGNLLCPGEDVLFNPGNGEDIILAEGFRVSVFAKGLNFPTGIAFRGNAQNFEIYVLESGGLPSSRCNDATAWQTKGLPGPNPFTPDIRVFDRHGTVLRTIAKVSDAIKGGAGAFPSFGPVVDIAFERGLQGGRLFVTEAAIGTIGTVDPSTGKVTPLITELPAAPTGQLAFRDGWIYWGAGSTTNNGVDSRSGLTAGAGPDIPCQDITLSDNVFASGGGIFTSGYSPLGQQNKGGVVPAFYNGTTGKVRKGVCNGAILRAPLRNLQAIEPFSWGYRNGYAVRFAPDDHPLAGGLLVGEDGPDEDGARPANNAPESLHLARQNLDGSPDYHGWPDRYGFLPASQAMFNPVGGPSDDLCVPDPSNPPSMCTAASLAEILKENIPTRDILAYPPQPITSPLAIEAPNSSFTAIDFVPDAFIGGPVRRGAALYTLEGDFGFSAANANAPAPEIGHEVKLINFEGGWGEPPALKMQRFAHNKTSDQAFVDGSRGFNRPTNLRFGPDGCAYVADYGAVRDFGRSDPETGVKNPADAVLVHIPGTGVIWKICRQ
jgi:hypothetical protein